MTVVVVRDMTLSDADRLEPAAGAGDAAFEMDEDTFRAFYDRTARALWGYLAHATGDHQLADDLLQETYYRFLRAGASWQSEAHRRNYLFKIATNLVRDSRRRRRGAPLQVAPDECATPAPSRDDPAEVADRRTDLARAMRRLKPRERALLWLAYAEGSTHREIAATLGVQAGSIKLLLFRARRKLAALLDALRVSRASGVGRRGPHKRARVAGCRRLRQGSGAPPELEEQRPGGPRHEEQGGAP